jgi:MYXO-CTERM domain-containing protein
MSLGQKGRQIKLSDVMEGVSMRSLAFGRTVSVVALLLATIMMVSSVPAALAQAPTTPPAETPRATTDMDDDSGNWGYLGLIGLLGLAGLMRRDRGRTIERPTEQERAGRL